MNAATAQDLSAAYALIRDNRHLDALRYLQDVVRENDGCAPAWTLGAQIFLHLRYHEMALISASKAVTCAPGDAEALYVLGRVNKALGKFTEAAACYARSVVLAPNNPDVLNSLGITLRELGQNEQAETCYREALAVRPDHPEALRNLGNLLASLGRYGEVADRAAEADARLLTRAQDLLRRANQLAAEGRFSQALPVALQAIDTAPDAAATHELAGKLYSEIGGFDKSLACFERAARLEPGHLDVVKSCQDLCITLGLVERAREHGEAVFALEPSDANRVAAQLALPAILASAADIEIIRTTYSAALASLLESSIRVEEPEAHRVMPGFYLAYHGRVDRDLQILAARAFLGMTPDLEWSAVPATATRAADGRIRIGIISRFLHSHSIGRTTVGLVRALPRSEFEIVVLRIPPFTDDEMSREIEAAADRILRLPESVAQSRARIAELGLDVLFYQDIGMEIRSYLLAFARLAPVQCVSFGHPNTTGIPNMDYFISNDLFERPDAESHYSERLFLLRGLPTLAYYYRPAAPKRAVGRTDVGFPDDGVIYFCPQTLFKVHPDFDPILRRILEMDPRGRVVFIRGNEESWSTSLMQRFAATVGEHAARIVFVDRMGTDAFLNALTLADVILDTPQFNGMNSSLESFAMGTPVVTLPGSLQRARHTAGMYRAMGIDDCVAGGADEYAEIAVRLGNDTEFASSVRQRIRERSHLLFESRRVIDEFSRFFRESVAAARAPVIRP